MTGRVDGVESKVELEGHFDFDRGQRRISDLGIAIREKRAVGNAGPGLDVAGQLRLVSRTAASPDPLDESTLAQLPLAELTAAELLSYSHREGRFHFLHDRRWNVLVERHDVVILRLVDQGALIAQCNISPLPDGPPDKQLSLSTFRQEVQRVLTRDEAQAAEASEMVTESGLRVLRVVVTGEVSEVPIQWNYYHLADGSGRRAALVFTFAAKLGERFADADQALIGSFEFEAPADAAEQARDAAAAGGAFRR